MSGIKYTEEQQEELNSNKHVKKCSEKYIQFTDSFKISCLKQDQEGIYHRDIFRVGGFPDFIVEGPVPKECLGNWRYAFKKQGWEGIMSKKKGRKKQQEQEKKDFSKMSIEEQNSYLKAEVAYLKELHVSIHGKYP